MSAAIVAVLLLAATALLAKAKAVKATAVAGLLTGFVVSLSPIGPAISDALLSVGRWLWTLVA